MRLTQRFHRPALALGLSLAVPIGAGCAEPTPHIVLDQPYTTGNPKYDDFFKAVRELHADAKRAEGEEAGTRAALITALGLEQKAPTELVVSEAGERAKKLRDTGLLLHLEIVPDPKIFTRRGGNLSPATKDLIKGAEDSTRNALALTARVGAIVQRAAELEKVRSDLRAQAPSTFRADVDAKRTEITRELDACAKVLTETADLGNRYAGLSAKFVIDLAHALEGGGNDTDGGKLVKDAAKGELAASAASAAAAAAAPPADTHAAPKKPPPPPPPTGAGAVASGSPAAPPATPKPPPAKPPATPKPPPAAPPPKKPKGGDDFEP